MSLILLREEKDDDEEEEENPFACFDDDDEEEEEEEEENDDAQQEPDDDDDSITKVGFSVKKKNDDHNTNNNKYSTAMRRDENGCGVLTFHAGTELALLQYVRMKLFTNPNFLTQVTTVTSPSTTVVSLPKQQQQQQYEHQLENIIHRAEQILTWMDEFCWERHWMMHIGPSKAMVLEQFLIDCFHSKQNNENNKKDTREKTNKKNKQKHPKQRQTNTDTDDDDQQISSSSFTMLELGTYCGYSAILLVKTLLKQMLHHMKETKRTESSSAQQQEGKEKFNDDDDDHCCFDSTTVRLYTVEVVEYHAKIAQEMIALAQLEPYIRIIINQNDDDLEATLRQLSNNNNNVPLVDFVFLDHDKSRYLSDLQYLDGHRCSTTTTTTTTNRLIHQGTYVAADNVIFAQIDDYRKYIQQLAQRGIVQTWCEEGLLLEYSHDDTDVCTGNINIEDDDKNISTTWTIDPSSSSLVTTTTTTTTTTKTVQVPPKILHKDGIELTIYIMDPPS